MAELCSEQNLLAASFFLSRPQRRTSCKQLFTTIAYQLSLLDPAIFRLTEKIASDCLQKKHDHQLQTLIIDPLLAAQTGTLNTMVVVIDALDECEDEDMVERIISLLARIQPPPSRLPLLFLITSRSEPYIAARFGSSDICSTTFSLDLREFHPQADISLYLSCSMREIYEKRRHVMRNVAPPWPSPKDHQDLVTQSSELFIFASTVLKFLDDKRRRPDQQLRIILDIENPSNSSAYGNLDKLYSHIIPVPGEDEGSHSVLGIIMLLFKPLSIEDLAHLLQRDSDDIRLALQGLHSVLLISDDEDNHPRIPIRPFHSSLRDFLLDRSRSGPSYIDLPVKHGDVARVCMQFMKMELRTGITFEELMRVYRIHDDHSFDDLCQKFQKSSNAALEYCCRNWVSHLIHASSSSELLLDIENMSSETIRAWSTCLHLLGSPNDDIACVEKLRKWAKVS